MRFTPNLRALIGVGAAALTFGLAAQAAAADDGGPQPPPFERQHGPIITAPIPPLPPAPPITPPTDITVVPPAPPITPPTDITVVPPAPPITPPTDITVVPPPPLTLPGGLPTTNPHDATTESGSASGDATTPPPAAGSDGSGSADGASVRQPWDPDQLSVEITLAQVQCDGTIHVEFGTVASPDPGWTTNHLILFNSNSDPAELHAVESAGNPANGTYVFEHPAAATETYRVLVVALFDPVNVAGAKAIDEAQTIPAQGC
jgi:hypothetical protein